jgi:hypothetical protein
MAQEVKMQEVQSFNLSLSDVPYDEKFKLNQASVSQLVRGLQEMCSRIGEPQNEYQKQLYPALKSIVETFVTKYTSILEASSEVQREVLRFNLHGYNGRIKKALTTRGVKFNLIYKYANFGDYLKTINQRVTYLVERKLPQRYVTNVTEGTAYEALRAKLATFQKYMAEDVEQAWNTAVTAARTAGGDSVQENLRKRTEKVNEYRSQKNAQHTETTPKREFKPRQQNRASNTHNSSQHTNSQSQKKAYVRRSVQTA